MKIPASVRTTFEEQREKYVRLQKEVDALIGSFKWPNWHYEGRVKMLQSFALKLESGRFKNPWALEDFFACTLVVSNLAEADKAEALIRERFEVLERRPKDPGITYKGPETFLFDDLRLYAAVRPDPSLPSTGLEGVKFEIQIKTFLQHAWSIATHDLVYKTDDVNWSKARIAYQIKAMLEHAEISIQEAQLLANSGSLAKEDEGTKDLKAAIALLRSQWDDDQLPTDIRRLAENVRRLASTLRIQISDIGDILDAQKASLGNHPSNLSPYATVVQYLFAAKREAMISFLQRDGQKAGILIPNEIALPDNIDRTKWKNAIFCRELVAGG